MTGVEYIGSVIAWRKCQAPFLSDAEKEIVKNITENIIRRGVPDLSLVAKQMKGKVTELQLIEWVILFLEWREREFLKFIDTQKMRPEGEGINEKQ